MTRTRPASKRTPRLALDLVIVGLGLAAPVTGAADVLIVLNKSDHEAALVDPKTLEVVAKLPTGQGPHEVATGTTKDGRRAFVANYGFYSIFKEGERPKMDPGNTITVIDLDARVSIAYVMNRMAPDMLGDMRGGSLVAATYASLAG